VKFDSRLNNTWWLLRLTFGLVPIVAGLDKFLNLLTNWEQYLSPAIPNLLHLSPVTFMHLVGIIEIVAGALVLSPLVGIAGYVVMAWLIAIAGNLLVQGKFFDIAVRDIVLAIAAYSLAKLTEVRQESELPAADHPAIAVQRT
jgi:uncharacterized membrane protein YphA (DoxX/SURF4 family)